MRQNRIIRYWYQKRTKLPRRITTYLTESEVFTGKSQTETLPSTRQGRGLRFSCTDRTFKANKLFIIWLFVLPSQAGNWHVGIMEEQCPIIGQSERV